MHINGSMFICCRREKKQYIATIVGFDVCYATFSRTFVA